MMAYLSGESNLRFPIGSGANGIFECVRGRSQCGCPTVRKGGSLNVCISPMLTRGLAQRDRRDLNSGNKRAATVDGSFGFR